MPLCAASSFICATSLQRAHPQYVLDDMESQVLHRSSISLPAIPSVDEIRAQASFSLFHLTSFSYNQSPNSSFFCQAFKGSLQHLLSSLNFQAGLFTSLVLPFLFPSPPQDLLPSVLPLLRMLSLQVILSAREVSFKENSLVTPVSFQLAPISLLLVLVVRRLGTGSYAVVYLVQEVLSQSPPSEDGHMSTIGQMEFDGNKPSHHSEVVYGRECLSKLLKLTLTRML
ncbi:hypothetical protein JOM56_014447 [Amanita muscaria]